MNGLVEQYQNTESLSPAVLMKSPVASGSQLLEETIFARLAAMEVAGVGLSRVAVETGLPRDEVLRWRKGGRDAQTTAALSAWLRGIDEDALAREGDFVMTPAASSYVQVFERARAAKNKDGRRGVALIFGASGTGKTTTAKWLERMDKQVVYVQVDGECRTWAQLLRQVAGAIDNYYLSMTTRTEPLRDLILRHIKPGGLLIFDHAQLISISLMEQLLTFPDEHGVGLAFIGNMKGGKAIYDAKVGQIMGRVAGARVVVGIASEEDIDQLLANKYLIAGRKEREFLLQIGQQDGGLHYLDAAIAEARKLSAAAGINAVTLDFLKLGAANAGCWGATL